jgi:hypothetical protein
VIIAPAHLPARHGLVAFKGRLALHDTNKHAALKVTVTTSHGQLQLHPVGVKIRGNHSRTITLTGSQTAVNQALNALSLLLGSSHTGAKITITATDGPHHQGKTIQIVAHK